MPWIEYFRVRGFILDRKCFATRVTSLIVFMHMTSNRAYFYWLLENLHDFQTKTFLMSQICKCSQRSVTNPITLCYIPWIKSWSSDDKSNDTLRILNNSNPIREKCEQLNTNSNCCDIKIPTKKSQLPTDIIII